MQLKLQRKDLTYMKTNRRHITHKEVMAKALKDPEFKKIWEAGKTRRKIAMLVMRKRIKEKLTQEEFADKIGMKQPSLARIESGSVMPSIYTLEKIATATNTRVDFRFV